MVKVVELVTVNSLLLKDKVVGLGQTVVKAVRTSVVKLAARAAAVKLAALKPVPV